MPFSFGGHIVRIVVFFLLWCTLFVRALQNPLKSLIGCFEVTTQEAWVREKVDLWLNLINQFKIFWLLAASPIQLGVMNGRRSAHPFHLKCTHTLGLYHGLLTWECQNFLPSSENCGISILLLFLICLVYVTDPLPEAESHWACPKVMTESRLSVSVCLR